MTSPTTDNQAQTEQKSNDKEINFAQMRQKYERELATERAKREEVERVLQEKERSKAVLQDDDEDDSEPYVDKKHLKKASQRLTQQIKQETQTDIQRAVQQALQEERKQNWLKQNNDFYEVLQHADKFAERDPELAETILAMPEGFERQKLVYKNIKALGIHKPDVKPQTTQDKIDANRRSPYYQPSGINPGPYSQVGDYSKQGQKQAFDKMQELKNRLRLS